MKHIIFILFIFSNTLFASSDTKQYSVQDCHEMMSINMDMSNSEDCCDSEDNNDSCNYCESCNVCCIATLATLNHSNIGIKTPENKIDQKFNLPIRINYKVYRPPINKYYFF